jgi:hypothetical protein
VLFIYPGRQLAFSVSSWPGSSFQNRIYWYRSALFWMDIRRHRAEGKLSSSVDEQHTRLSCSPIYGKLFVDCRELGLDTYEDVCHIQSGCYFRWFPFLQKSVCWKRHLYTSQTLSNIIRHWKDHLKNDRRSDQDHPFKKMILDQDQIIYHFLPPKSPFKGHFFNFWQILTFLTN